MKGKSLTSEQVQTVIRLLGETDISLKDIAKRMRCGSHVITRINRENGLIRDFRVSFDQKKEKPLRKRFIVKDVKGGFL